MLGVLVFAVPAAESAAFTAEAEAALAILAPRPGCRSSRLARSVDDPDTWILVSEWAGVGDYRRALSGYDVKVALAPLLARAVPLPSAFEVLRTEGPDGGTSRGSDRSGS